MKMKYLFLHTGRNSLLVALVFLLLTLMPGGAFSADNLDPEADRILRTMSDYFGGTKAFSVNADIGNEIITYTGEKLQLSSASTVVMQRPDKFHVTRKGIIADLELTYDGKLLTLYGKNLNLYAQHQVAGNSDDAIKTLEMETGLDAPGADLLFSDPYSVLSSGVDSSSYIGTDYVNGIECHHLAFREKKVDWQLWVQAGATPLPMKYIITSKWQTGSPQYSVQFRDWNTKPVLNTNLFTFSVPQGALSLASLKADELGNLVPGQEEK